MDNDLREQLAAYAHEAWSHWMKYMFAKSNIVVGRLHDVVEEGDVVIPNNLAVRWQRQARTPYDQLSEEEKTSDREQADEILKIICPVVFVVGFSGYVNDEVDSIWAVEELAKKRAKKIGDLWASQYFVVHTNEKDVETIDD